MNYGIGTYISELTRELLKHNDLNIFLVSYNSCNVKELTIYTSSNAFVNIYVPRPINLIDNEIQTVKYAARIVDLLNGVFEKSTNVVIQVNFPSSLSIVKEIKRRFNFPVLSVIHSANWQFLTIGNKQKFIEVWERRELYDKNSLKELNEEMELYEVADKIVSVTDYMKKFVVDYYSIDSSKVSVIRNGMDCSEFSIPTKIGKKTLKEQLGFGSTDKIVLYVGRLDNGKGLQQLLEAFNEVFIKDKSIKLVIIGEDSGSESIKQFLSCLKDSWCNVTFTGFLVHADVVKFYQIADAGILPSLYDHCPYVALEMAAHDIPLIISDTEGLNEMFDQEQAFYIEPVVDVRGRITFDKFETANAIITMLNDAKKRHKLVRHYPGLIKTKFSGSRMGNEMYKVLKNLINGDKVNDG